MDLQILKYPHPALRFKTVPVKRINDELRETVAKMFEAMYEHEGVGLAANQVGLPFQICVINTTGDREKPECEEVLINPVIRRRKGSAEESEGCLSFPEISAPVVRPEEVEVEAVALNGEVRRFHWKGLMARAAQHELDHLQGVSFIDRLTPAALLSIRDELETLEIEMESNRKLGFVPPDEEIREEMEAMAAKQSAS